MQHQQHKENTPQGQAGTGPLTGGDHPPKGARPAGGGKSEIGGRRAVVVAGEDDDRIDGGRDGADGLRAVLD